MRRSHSPEFKLDLCRRIAQGEVSKCRACRKHGLSHGMMDRWMDQFLVLGEESFQGGHWRAQSAGHSARILQFEKELRLRLTLLYR